MIEQMLLPLKKGKHLLFLAKKNYPNFYDSFWCQVSPHINYEYSADRYREKVYDVTVPTSSTFLVNHLLFSEKLTSTSDTDLHKVPDQMFCFWTGGNPLSENRKNALNILQKNNLDLKINVITEDSLDEWVMEGHPLHPAYKYLSYVHRSDYLRTYFMHYYGGVYSDIKGIEISWKKYIDYINSSDTLYAGGPAEFRSFNVSPAMGDGKLGRDQKRNFSKILFPAAYLCRPRTEFTESHLNEIERRLNYFYPLLENNPAEQPMGLNLNYPISWTALHGQIFAPLCLKFNKNIKVFDTAKVSYSDYR